MKKIVPFNNVLNFKTDVSSVTAISLEHDTKISSDSISGTFYITGEYKITDGQIDREHFDFELPFDIALGSNYNLDTLVVDIDDFRYELVDRNKLKINIDLYIDGEIMEEYREDMDMPIENDEREVFLEESNQENEENSLVEEGADISKIDITDIVSDVDDAKEDNKNIDINIDNNNDNSNDNDNVNIFSGFNEDDKYVTYRVYRVVEGDSLDKILDKYKVSKEEFSKYNGSLEIKPGDKLIIPAND